MSAEPRSPLKFDEFGKLSCTDEQARLDNYGRFLQQQQSAGLAVIIVYAGRSDTRVGEVMARLFGMRDRLISASSIDSKRILILDGGVRDELLVQFWVLPPDARESALALFDLPSMKKDPRLRSPRMEKWEYKCGRVR